jgi:hypothetical protein
VIPPIQFEGVQLDDATNFAALALRSMSGLFGSRPNDVDPGQGAVHVYEGLRALGSPYAGRFSQGVAAALTDPRPEIRHYAVMFFDAFPDAPGAERVNDLVEGPDRRLFDQTKVLSYSLEFSLLRLLGARVRVGDGRALALARAEALRPGKADGVIASLAANDTDWLLANLEQVASGSPGNIKAILRQLLRAGRDVVPVGIRLAHAPGVSAAELRSAVEERVADPQAKARILAALGG